MITLTYTSSWRKQHKGLNMLHPLNPSNDIGMVMEHGMHLPANMLEKTSGRLRLRNKSNCCTHMSGKDRAISCLNISSPNITMHMYQCQPVLNTFNTSCLMNVPLIDAIQCADTRLQATMASVKMDNGPNGLRNNSERAVSHLLPYDPIAKK